MERKTKRTITEVLDYETGECIDAETFFKKPIDELTVYRSELQKAIEGIRETLFACYYCKQKIRIRGGIASSNKKKTEIFHFAHLKDSEECHIKTKNQLTKEQINSIKYNGAKESIWHQTLKDHIAKCLKRNQETKEEVSSIEVEKVIRDKVAKEWKKPDINAFFHNKRIAIELQLSTTWLDIITRRQHFYKEQGIYIFWVFHTFNLSDDLRRLTYDDVIYTNNQNAYIFDKETYEKSKLENDLILKCYYKTYYRYEQDLMEVWEYTFIKLSDLTFDENKFRIYYHDSNGEKKKVEEEIEVYISELRDLGRLKILEEKEQKRKRKELESRIAELKDDINGVNEEKKQLDQKQNDVIRKLNELKEFESKSDDYSDKTVKYFIDNQIFNKPFYDHDELLKLLREEYKEKLISASKSISEKSQENKILSGSLVSINNLTTIEIGGKLYSSINNTTDWNFIKNNYTQIKTIHKNSIHGLFAGDEIKPVLNEYDLNQFQYSKDILFLTDFSSKILEFIEKKKINENIIGKQESFIALVKKEIKEKLDVYFREKIIQIDKKVKNNSEKQVMLNNEIKKRENELSNLKI